MVAYERGKRACELAIKNGYYVQEGDLVKKAPEKANPERIL